LVADTDGLTDAVGLTDKVGLTEGDPHVSSSMGDEKVGLSVGILDVVGLTEGDPDDGLNDLYVGDIEAFLVGGALGLRDGNMLGTTVGIIVGVILGPMLGNDDGKIDGSFVDIIGFSDGLFEGIDEG